MTNKNTKNGFKWAGVSVLTQYMFHVLAFLYVARIIGPSSIGDIAASLFIVNLLKIFVELGFPQSLIQNNETTKSDRDSALTLMFIISICFLLIVYVLRHLVGGIFSSAQIAEILPALSLLLPIFAVSLPFLAWLERDFRFKEIAILNVTSSIISYPIIGINLAFLDFGVWSLVWANIAYPLLNLLGFIYLNRKERYEFKKVSIKRLSKFSDFCLHFTSARFANFIALEVDNLIVGWKFGVANLGLYSRAYQLMTLPATLIGTVGDKVLFPIFSRESNLVNIKKSLIHKIYFISFFTIPLTWLMISISEPIVWLILGEKWLSVAPLLTILSLALYFRIATRFIDSTVRALGYVKQRAKRQFLYAGIVVVSVLFSSFYDLESVAYAIVLSIICNYIIMSLFLFSKIKQSFISIAKINFMHFIYSYSCLKLTELFFDITTEYSFLQTSIEVLFFITTYYLIFFLGLWFIKHILNKESLFDFSKG